MYETTEARDAEKSYQPFVLHSHTDNPGILHYPRLWKRHEHLILQYKTEGSVDTVLDLSFASRLELQDRCISGHVIDTAGG